MRLLFAGFVVYSHSYYLSGKFSEPLFVWSEGKTFLGHFGVLAFFVLSGYLITKSFENSPSIWRFLWHRFLRLYPALWVCLLVTAFILGPLVFFTGVREGSYLAMQPSPIGFFTENLFSPYRQITIGSLFSTNPFPVINGSLWTLFYEAFCYLGVAVFGLAGFIKVRKTFGVVMLFSILCLYLLWHVSSPGWLPTKISRLFDTPGKVLCVHFLSGMILALVPDSFFRILVSRGVILISGFLLGLGIFLKMDTYFTPFVLAPLVLGLSGVLPFRNFEKRVGGDYSYGLYIYAYPIQQILVHFKVHEAGVGALFFSSVILALLMAVLSWKFVEKPCLGLKNIWRSSGS